MLLPDDEFVSLNCHGFAYHLEPPLRLVLVPII